MYISYSTYTYIAYNTTLLKFRCEIFDFENYRKFLGKGSIIVLNEWRAPGSVE